MDSQQAAADLYELVVIAVRRVSAERNQDLSLPARTTMSFLARSGPARITALAGREGVSQPSMTQLVQRLEARGLVHRATDPTDGRASLVALTDAGRDALAAHRVASTAALADLLRAVPDRQARALADAVHDALPALRQASDDPVVLAS